MKELIKARFRQFNHRALMKMSTVSVNTTLYNFLSPFNVTLVVLYSIIIKMSELYVKYNVTIPSR